MKASLALSCVAAIPLFISSPLFGEVTLDMSFNPGTEVNGLIESSVLQPDGKILVCGNFSSFNNSSHGYVARLNSDGSIDESFKSDVGYWVRTMALQSDGKVVIGGFFTDVQGIARNRIARLNSDGSLDTTFNPGRGCQTKIVPPDPWEPFVFAVAVQPDGKILIGGNFVTYNGVTTTGLVRVNSDGSIDPSFHVGAGVNSWVRSLLVQPNGQIMVTGWFTSYDNHNHSRMVLLNSDGSDDQSFTPNFGESTAVYTVAQTSLGQYIVAGHSANTNDPGYWAREMARLNPDGSFDKSFLGFANEKVESVQIQPDGKIVMGGYFSAVDGARRSGLARLNADGSLDDSFAPEANNYVWTILLQNDGRIIATGGFSAVNGVARPGVARLGDPPPPPPSAEHPQPPPTPTYVAQAADTRTVLLTGMTTYTATLLNSGRPVNPRNHIVAVDDFNHDGKADFVWQQNTTGAVSLWFMDETNIVGTSALGNQPATRGWRVAASGDFNGDGQKDLVLQNGTKLSFWFLNGTNVESTVSVARQMAAGWRIAAAGDFNNDGQLDLVWQYPFGRLAVTHMNGATFLDSVVLKKRLPSGFGVRAVRDFNGDGQSDLLLQNGSGVIAIWDLNGTEFVGSSARGRTAAAWKIIGVN